MNIENFCKVKESRGEWWCFYWLFWASLVLFVCHNIMRSLYSQTLDLHTLKRLFHYQQIKDQRHSQKLQCTTITAERQKLRHGGNTQQYALSYGYSGLSTKDQFIFNWCEKPTCEELRGNRNSTKSFQKVGRYAHDNAFRSPDLLRLEWKAKPSIVAYGTCKYTDLEVDDE